MRVLPWILAVIFIGVAVYFWYCNGWKVTPGGGE